jgi:quinoprotein glucose dehydrogenase
VITRRLVAVLVSAVAAGYVALAGQRAPDEKPWIGYAGSADGSRFFNSKQIDKNNVRVAAGRLDVSTRRSRVSPMMAHGTVYGRRRTARSSRSTPGRKGALDPDGLQGMTTRGMDYWESPDGRDRRLIFSMNDYLQEIDAATGKSIMTFGTGGVVDLREGLGRDPATMGRVQSGTPGQVFENLILLGSAPGEGYMSPPGDLRAYDVITGKLVWQFHTIPHPGEFGYETWPKDAWKYAGAANAWGELTIDAKRGIAYFPTGSPTYDFYGADRIGANLFSDCLIALDARTGKRLWHFQTTHHDLWDFDNNAAPQLTTIRHNGRTVDVVALAGKTGFLYVFDRVTGTPIWPIEERPVPKGDMPGEEYWPTQPFPTNPPPFVRQSFSIDDVSSLSNVAPAARQQLLERLATAKNVGLFTPISTEWTVHIPGNNGGALFGTTTAEPATGRVYVVGQNNPAVLRLYKPGEGPARAGGPGASPGQEVYQRYCQQCHGADRGGAPTGPTLLTVPGRLDADSLGN